MLTSNGTCKCLNPSESPVFGFGDSVFLSRNGVVFTLEKAVFGEVLGKGRCGFFFLGWVGLGSGMNNARETSEGNSYVILIPRVFLGE